MPFSSRFVSGDKSVVEIKRGVYGGFQVRKLTPQIIMLMLTHSRLDRLVT